MGDSKRSGMIIVVGGAVAAIATFLNAFSVSVSAAGFSESDTQNYFGTDDGKLVFGLAILIVIFGAMAMMGKAPKASSILGIVFSALLLAVTFIDYSDTASVEEDITGGLPVVEGVDFAVEASVGIGLYLAMAGALIALVGSIMALRARKSAGPTGGMPAMESPGTTGGQAWTPPTGAPPSSPMPPPGGAPPPPGSGYPPSGGSGAPPA